MLGFTSVLVQEGGIGSLTATMAKMVADPYGPVAMLIWEYPPA